MPFPLSNAPLPFSIYALSDENESPWTVGDNALHFIIRHWHTDADEDVMYPGNSLEDDGNGNFFVLMEGYIVPRESTDEDTEKIEFFMAEQRSGTLIKFGDGDRDNEVIFTDPPYIVNVDEDNGMILVAVVCG